MPKRPVPPSPASALPTADSRERILAAAEAHLFPYGYSAFTMDDLARELGMSKKTLYLHFPSKDAIVEEILNRFAGGVRALAEEIFSDAGLSFPLKMYRFGHAMLQRLSRPSPAMLRDLQRFAPHLYRKLEDLRHRNIPLVFGQIVRQGQAAGVVRPGLDPDFVIEYWRPAIQSLMHPDTLERLQLRPDEMMRRAMDLFCGGLLTPAGRKEYEKHLPPS